MSSVRARQGFAVNALESRPTIADHNRAEGREGTGTSSRVIEYE